MRMLRPMFLFTCTVGVALLLGGVTLEAAQTAKAQKKLQKKAKAKKNRKKDRGKGLNQAPAEAARPLPPLPALPGAIGPKDAQLVAQMIDKGIGQKLIEAKASAAPLCTDDEFLRRAYLDLTGVIPTAEKARSFLESRDSDKRARLIDELLSSPLFGRHLADIWQAKLLPRESGNRFVLREPFVKWLESEFNKNTPWNKVVATLVAGSGTVEKNPAVTFFLANRSVDKIADSVTVNFLGVQLQCAQCHNHPFTDWKQTEYWGMAEFFSKVRPENPRNAARGGDNTKIGVIETRQRSRVKAFFPESEKQVPPKFLGGQEPQLSPTQAYRPTLAQWMTDPNNPYFAKAIVNRTWAQLFGRGFVNPIDDMHEGNVPSHPELLAALSRNFAGHGFDLKNLYRSICNSQTYQRSSKPTDGSEDSEKLFSHQTMKVLSPGQLYDSLVLATGLDKAMAARAKRAPAGKKRRNGNGPRDQFVQFFLAGAEEANATEYEAGIPQALKMMNSRATGTPNLIRQFASAGDKPQQVFERIYLATLSRKPTPAESRRLASYVDAAESPVQGYSDILWVVLNSSEFAMIR